MSDIGGEAQLKTMSALPLDDGEWLYHTTTRTTALLIKEGGMRSALRRTGQAKADPNGAFAKDRDKRFPTVVSQNLQKLVFNAYKAQLRLDQLGMWVNGPPGKTFAELRAAQDKAAVETAALSIGAAYIQYQLQIHPPKLEEPATSNIAAQPSSIIPSPAVSSSSGTAVLKPWQKPGHTVAPKPIVKQVAPPVVMKKTDFSLYNSAEVTNKRDELMGLAGHFLTQLATEWATMYFAVEEAITSSHIYLSTAKGAANTYKKYMPKLVGTVVVLRVRSVYVPNQTPDDSEQDGVKSTAHVATELLEVMVNHEQFPDIAYRSNPANWMPLSHLT